MVQSNCVAGFYNNGSLTHARNLTLNEFIIQIGRTVYAIYGIYGVWLAFANNEYMPLYSNIMKINIYLCVPFGLCLIIINNKRIFKRFSLSMLILPLTYLMYLILHTKDGYRGDWLLAFVVISSFCLMDSEQKVGVFRRFYQIVQLTNVMAIGLYMINLFKIDLGFQRVLYYSPEAEKLGLFYEKLGIFAIYMGNRLCSIYNEPGGLGTLCALLFIATNRYTKLWEKMILIIAGGLSFSFAFYLLMFSYFFVYLIRKGWKNLIYIFVFILVFFTIPKIDFKNELLNRTAARFELTEGGLKGDNRTNAEFDYKFDELKQGSQIWLGLGRGALWTYSGVSSYKIWIVEFGILGFTYWMIEWLTFAFWIAKKNPDACIFTFFFFLSLYQRPMLITNMYGFLLLFGGIEWLNYERRQCAQKIDTNAIIKYL